MKYTLALTDEAEDDLAAIHRHIAADSPSRAGSMIDALIEAMTILELFPKAGRERSDISPGLFTLPKDSYLITYRIVGDTVEIYRVIHAARDVRRVLGSDPT